MTFSNHVLSYSFSCMCVCRILLERNPGGVVLSTDDYFSQHGEYHFDPALLGEAHGWNHKRSKQHTQSSRTSVPVFIYRLPSVLTALVSSCNEIVCCPPFLLAKDACEAGVNPIIIDNTNMQGWEMRPYVIQVSQLVCSTCCTKTDVKWS